MGLTWRKEINATAISLISSDRICGLRVKSPHPISPLLECTYLVQIWAWNELERVVSEHQHSGPVVIMGDFNARLGVLGGVRGIGEPNQQWVHLHQFITRCNLYAVSRPQYTFQNSLSQTTVDYILVSHDTTEYMLQCFTHDHAPLNNSDHLPITATLQFSHSTAIPQEQLTKNRIQWAKALKDTHLHGYQKSVSSFVAPLIGRSYSSAEEINDEITEEICSAALQSLPLCKSSVKVKKWYTDQTLSRLASAKKAAWDKWSANGRPREGPLYDAKIKTRAEFRKRMRVCAERKRIQHFDEKFKLKSSSRFRIPSTKTRQSP